MKAKDRHRRKLLEHLADPNNDFPSRKEMASICGIERITLYTHFTPDELSDIEHGALELRRKRYAKEISKADRALLREAETGNPQAIKLVYQRFEHWNEKSTTELTGLGGGPIETKYTFEIIKAK